MSQAALFLSGLAILLGLWPLVPPPTTPALLGAACGVLPALGGFFLALHSRGRALRDGTPVGLRTVALGAAVLATALCGFWLVTFVYFLLRR